VAVVAAEQDFEVYPLPGGLEFTQSTGYSEDVSLLTAEGKHSRRYGVTVGGGGVARLNTTVSWDTLGTDVYFGALIRPCVGFYAAQDGQARIMGWTDFNGSTQKVRGGAWIDSNDVLKIYRHVENAGGANEQNELLDLGAARLPEGVWTALEIHQYLSDTDGQALTEAYINDVRVGVTAERNINAGVATGPITRMRFGLDDATGISGALHIDFDRCYVDVRRRFSSASRGRRR
jgi:hypothetical protein